MQKQPDYENTIITVLIMLAFVAACFILPNLMGWIMDIAQYLKLSY